MARHVYLTFTVVAACLLMGCAPDYEARKRQFDHHQVKMEVKRAKAQYAVNEVERRDELKQAKHESGLKKFTINADMENECKQLDANMTVLAREDGISLSRKYNLGAANHRAANALVAQLIGADCLVGEVMTSLAGVLLKRGLKPESPILVASLVNLDDLTESSTFGRTVSEQVASQFNKRNYHTAEVRLGSDLFLIERSGEFALTRKMREIAMDSRAHSVVVGTYAVARDYIRISLRVVEVVDSLVLAAHDYAVPISLDTYKMLRTGASDLY